MGQGASGAGAGDSKPTEQQAAQREKVFREIVATENTYVANLALVQQHFLEPLKNKKVLTEAEIAQVFNNLEVLLGQHRQLLAALKARESTWAKEDQVADIFLKQTEYLKVYTQYMTGYQSSVAAIIKLSKSNSSWKSFRKDAEKRASEASGLKLTLEDYLITPVQRLPRYRLLLEEMLKATPPRHKDHANLELAIRRMKEVLDYLNAQQRTAEDLQKMRQLQTTIVNGSDYDIPEKNATWCRDGNVKLRSPKGAEEPLYFVLLSHELLLLQPYSNILHRKKQWKLEARLQLEDLSMHELAIGTPGAMVALELRVKDGNGEKHVIIVFPSADEKARFIGDVTAAQSVLRAGRYKILQEGFLCRPEGIAKKEWKRRYFILTKEPRLSFYEGSLESTRRLKGHFTKGEVKAVRASTQRPHTLELEVMAFSLTALGRKAKTLLLVADTATDQQNWIKNIKLAFNL